MGVSLQTAMEKVLKQVDRQKPALVTPPVFPHATQALMDNPVFVSLLKQLQEARGHYLTLQIEDGIDAPMTMIAADRVESLLSAIQTVWIEQTGGSAAGVKTITMDDILSYTTEQDAKANENVLAKIRREREKTDEAVETLMVMMFLRWSLDRRYEWDGKTPVRKSFESAA